MLVNRKLLGEDILQPI